MNLFRQYVGGPKNRYKDQKFNLDLTYITPRLIAMAFPASGFEKLYRNPIQTVKDFLIQHHGNDYMIINLSGREVDQSVLQNVITYDWQDHQAPPLQMLFNVCEKMSEFLCKNYSNVVAVNCNHGKGRTGTIVCCFLLYCNMFKDAELTMDFYAKKRFQVQQGFGVTQPCQVLYIKYLQRILHNENPFLRPRAVSINKIIFRGTTKFQTLYIKAKKFNGQNLFSTKRSQSKTAYQKRKNQQNVSELILTLMQPSYLCGDCKLFIKTPSALGTTSSVATYSFNTAFLQGNSHIIDFFDLSPYSLRKSDNFSRNFKIQLIFEDYCDKCPLLLQYQKKCNKCRQILVQEQDKWKKIMAQLYKRRNLQQKDRESMLGYHLKNNIPKLSKAQNQKQQKQQYQQLQNQKQQYQQLRLQKKISNEQNKDSANSNNQQQKSRSADVKNNKQTSNSKNKKSNENKQKQKHKQTSNHKNYSSKQGIEIQLSIKNKEP